MPAQLQRRPTMASLMPSYNLKDEGDLMYTTLVGMVMAAIFATGFHEDVDETLTSMAPEGTVYPFPAHTRGHAAVFASAITGFILGVTIWTIAGQIRWAMVRKLLAYRDWLTNPKSAKTKAWGLALKILIPKRRLLCAFEHVLPKLPLPPLESSCEHLLRNTEALLSDEQFTELKNDIDAFKVKEGKTLHSALEERYNREENWVSDLWDKYAYLAFRGELAVNLNISASSALDKKTLEYVDTVKQVGRAAAMTYQFLTLNELINDKTLNPLLVQNLVPLCMDRYKYVLGCSRLPGEQMDSLKTYDTKHIIVLRKGFMYKLDVYALTAEGEETLLTPEELQTQLELIINHTGDASTVNPSVLTGQNRTVWAKERGRLKAKKVNAESLDDVESAILHLSLEDTSPKNLSEEGKANLCSTGYNRWFDKSLTIIVYKNSLCGVNIEHTTADGTICSRMLEYAWGHSQYDAVGNAISSGLQRHYKMNAPKKLQWDLTMFDTSLSMHEKNLLKLCDNVDFCNKVLRHGKGAIKKCRVSPDDFVQMSLQLAFYRMHKSTPKTYESASTRFFKYGRTETIRTATVDSKAFVLAMDDPNVPNAECKKLLKKAVTNQHKYKLLATNGQGCDRHLFGLYMMAKLKGIQSKLFTHKVLFEPDHLSTSQCPFFYDKKLSDRMTMYPSGGNFGAQREDGYGIYYLFLGENSFSYHVASWHSCKETSSVKMADEVEKALLDIRKMLQEA